MSDIEKRAHDLAILYMQLEIKEGTIVTAFPEDLRGFVSEYQNLYGKFLTEVLEAEASNGFAQYVPPERF